jgi:hypothetical protein
VRCDVVSEERDSEVIGVARKTDREPDEKQSPAREDEFELSGKRERRARKLGWGLDVILAALEMVGDAFSAH